MEMWNLFKNHSLFKSPTNSIVVIKIRQTRNESPVLERNTSSSSCHSPRLLTRAVREHYAYMRVTSLSSRPLLVSLFLTASFHVKLSSLLYGKLFLRLLIKHTHLHYVLFPMQLMKCPSRMKRITRRCLASQPPPLYMQLAQRL